MNKLTKYIIAVVILLGVNLILLFSGFKKSSPEVQNYFNQQDLQKMNKIMFIVDGETTKIEKSAQEWILNDEFKADDGFVNTLISILEKVEVKRIVETWDSEIVGLVEVEVDHISKYVFQFATNPGKTKSYFISEKTVKEVAVPGYRDNVVDVFTLHPDQWRDRLVVNGSWRTIQHIKVENRLEEDFEILFQDEFFLVNGKVLVDSSAVIAYLNQFQQFHANEMISTGRFPELDSLSESSPLVKVTIDDIMNDAPFQLMIYPNEQRESYHLVVDNTGQKMVIDSERIRKIITIPENLEQYDIQ